MQQNNDDFYDEILRQAKEDEWHDWARRHPILATIVVWWYSLPARFDHRTIPPHQQSNVASAPWFLPF